MPALQRTRHHLCIQGWIVDNPRKPVDHDLTMPRRISPSRTVTMQTETLPICCSMRAVRSDHVRFVVYPGQDLRQDLLRLRNRRLAVRVV